MRKWSDAGLGVDAPPLLPRCRLADLLACTHMYAHKYTQAYVLIATNIYIYIYMT